jgi:hypothetical protein
LAILLIDKHEITLETFVHDLCDVPEIELKKGLKEEHLEAIVIENAITCDHCTGLLVFVTGKTLSCLKDLSAPVEELISLSFIKSVDNQALPKDLKLLWLKDGWARPNQKFQEIESMM